MTFIPLALILFFFCRRIRRELINPLGHILRNSDLEHAVALHRMTPRYREPLGLLEIFNQAQEDIHELKKENTQLTTALDYAHNAEENRRRMVSNITHELKTPLAVIHSYAEGLKEGIAAEKQEHYLDVILEETQRMDGMVLEMLDLSRLEAGKVRLATDRFSLLELTQRVVDKMNLLVEERELKVEYVWKQEVEVTADEGRIAQAVTNLVSNAIKYSPRGGTIYVSVTRVKDKTLFSIENQSEPLSEEALNSIWDSFYRADASRTEKGTGLGLPITKAIVELHGGECQVSNTSTGVEFKFYLP
jgi:signal transduction histidine kinase